MILDFLVSLGIWNWIAFGLILLILEILAPGIFFIWFALAALVTGSIALLFGTDSGLSWQVQSIIFLVLAVTFVLIGRRAFGVKNLPADPLLNQRGQQLIGQRATLTEPIINGRGRIKINDTSWRVKGRDLPAGTEVIVVAFDPNNLELDINAVTDEQ